jgi:hypothetical protein
MTSTLLTDIAERFPLGAPNGFMPTTEPVSDTAMTPFGLTLRTAPTPVSPGIEMVTEKVTTPSTDGNGKDADFDYDVATDIG